MLGHPIILTKVTLCISHNGDCQEITYLFKPKNSFDADWLKQKKFNEGTILEKNMKN